MWLALQWGGGQAIQGTNFLEAEMKSIAGRRFQLSLSPELVKTAADITFLPIQEIGACCIGVKRCRGLEALNPGGNEFDVILH